MALPITILKNVLDFNLMHIEKVEMESLEGDRKGSYSLTVSANYRLIIKPKAKDQSTESLKRCDTFVIEGMIDYHGKGTKYNWIIP